MKSMQGSKKRLKRYSYWSSLLCLCCIALNPSFAQKSLEHDWQEPLQAGDTIPPQFQKAPAIFLEKKLFRSSRFESRNFLLTETRQGRLLFKNAQGVEAYTKIRFPLDLALNIYTLDARIFRDGEIIDLQPNQLERVFDGELTSEMVFKIPGVQVGDIVEWIVKRKGEKTDPGGNIFFHDEIPVLHSSVQFAVSADISLATKQYNGLKAPTKINYWSGKKYEWTVKNAPPLPQQTLAIPALTQPYLAYNLDFKKLYSDRHFSQEMTWFDLLESIYKEELSIKEGKPQVLQKWYTDQLAQQSDTSLTEQVKRLHHCINKEIKLKENEEQEANRGLSYFLEKGRMNRLTLLKLYRNLLERHGLDFYLAVGKSRYLGPLDLEFPDHAQISELFFVFKNEKDRFCFLFPKTDHQLPFNKLPAALEGTVVFLYNSSDPKNLTKLTLPYSQPGANRIDRHYKVSVDLENEILSCQSEEKYTGVNARETAAFFARLEANNKTYRHLSRQLRHRIAASRLTLTGLELTDEVQDSSHFRLCYDWQMQENLTVVDSNLIKIDLQNWFQHDFPPVDFRQQKLAVYPSFKGTDSYRYDMHFDRDVKLIGESKIISIKKESGEYLFRIFQETAKTISIESRFALFAKQVPINRLEELVTFKEIIDAQNSLYLLLELSAGFSRQ